MTTPTPSHEAAMKAVDTIMSLTDSPVSIFSVRSYQARCVDIIEAKFAPIVEKAAAADVFYKALADACESEDYCYVCGHKYDRHGLDCKLETYEAAQKAKATR